MVVHTSMRFPEVVASGSLRMRRSRIGETIRAEDGEIYEVFLETTGREADARQHTTVLLVGFRLRFVGQSRLLNLAFRHVCLLSAPLWSGFPGFRDKLWMASPRTRSYLGVYEWADELNAKAYVNWIVNLLLPFTIAGSIWYDIVAEETITNYLDTRRLAMVRSKRGILEPLIRAN